MNSVVKYNILASGSKGNCIIIEDSLMLDCGVPFKTIKDEINKVKVIFISHIHGRRPFKRSNS